MKNPTDKENNAVDNNSQSADETVIVQARRKKSEDATRFVRPSKVRQDKNRQDKNQQEKTRLKARSESPGNKASVNPLGTAAESSPPQQADKTRFIKPKPSQKTQIKPASTAHPQASNPTLDAAKNTNKTVLKERFILETVLGSGGMGVVYKARDLLKIEAKDRDPYVAIKVLSDEFKAHPEAFIALQRESRKSQSIAHPNIVNVHDFDKDGDTVFMTMEFLDGKPLDKLIRQYKSTGLPHEDVQSILKDICAALIYAHAKNIIHSDFKPGNIFVTSSGASKVFDFGIARAVGKADVYEDDAQDKTVFDASSLGALTPAYASPEMLEGKQPDARDDIYALGCIAYELYTGKHPFNRVHADEAQRQGLKPKRIKDIRKNQWRAIEKSLAFERKSRLRSVGEFWATFNKRYKPGFFLYMLLTLVLVGAAGSIFYYLQPKSETINELAVYNKVRMEFYENQIESLLAKPLFTASWEERVWEIIQDVRKMLKQDEPWLVSTQQIIVNLYVEKIQAEIADNNFSRAEQLINHAMRYSNNKDTIDSQQALLAAAIEKQDALTEQQALKEQEELKQQQELKRQQQAELAKSQAKPKPSKQSAAEQRKRARYSQFQAAYSNVQKELNCQTSLNMRNLSIAVDKLRQLNAPEYRKREPEIVKNVAACINKVGLAFPKRAAEMKKTSLRLFPGNPAIAAIYITPKDACAPSLAGLGAKGTRGICRDEAASFGSGPALVVIPAGNNLQSFAIGKYEVSVAEMNRFCKQSSRCEETSTTSANLPIANISYELSQAYLKWLSDKTQKTYRLPTQDEWLYAARSIDNKLIPNRNCRLDSRGIEKGNALLRASLGFQNSWGLVNHIGNVREWVVSANGNL
ncbi:MAG: bifunctional serine/threonine-protein kinase/formylglycine-generating enzyme family protein, partial [Pseudomonadota bacterium]